MALVTSGLRIAEACTAASRRISRQQTRRRRPSTLTLLLLLLPALLRGAEAEAGWPLGAMLPDSVTAGWKPLKIKPGETPKSDVLLWTPPETPIRAALLIVNNSDSKHIGEHPAVRAVAARQGMAIVYLRRFDGSVLEYSDPPAMPERLPAALAAVAEATGQPALAQAPWITLGKSSRGRFPFHVAWLYPQRTIACIGWHGQTPGWPTAAWASPAVKTESILQLNINGDSEWDETWYRHVRPCQLNYRAGSAWLCHQVVVPGVGHGDYADGHGSPGWGQPVPAGKTSVLTAWDYLALFMAKALALRLPDGEVGAAPLRAVDPASGWLVHPRAPDLLLGRPQRVLRRGPDGAFLLIDHIAEPGVVLEAEPPPLPLDQILRPAAAVPEGERAGLLWLADRELALAWLALHNVSGAAVTLAE